MLFFYTYLIRAGEVSGIRRNIMTLSQLNVGPRIQNYNFLFPFVPELGKSEVEHGLNVDNVVVEKGYGQ
jgi:hypothetical protein